MKKCTSPKNESKICVICKEAFLGTYDQKYCSQSCFKKYYFHPKEQKTKICVECQKGFLTSRSNQIYCSKFCVKKSTNKTGCFENIPAGTVGAIQELRVCVDLLKKGYEVFRAVSPSCSCDLLVHKDAKFFGIEVRTAYKTKRGKIYPSSKNIKVKNLALVLPDEIIYLPETFS